MYVVYRCVKEELFSRCPDATLRQQLGVTTLHVERTRLPFIASFVTSHDTELFYKKCFASVDCNEMNFFAAMGQSL